MTTKIRTTNKYTVYKSLAGMGICFLRHSDGEQTLWDTSFEEEDIGYLVGCTEEECNNFITKQISFL